MDNENYISPNKITKQYDITSGTLRRWSEAGKIRCLRPNGGKRIYHIEDIQRIFSSQKVEESKNENEDVVENIEECFNKIQKNIKKHSTSESDNLDVDLNQMKHYIQKLKRSAIGSTPPVA
jgi:DNA-binding transcriptional MerR regulator